MNMPYLGESTDSILGKEFLTWLWYQSDTAPGAFTDKEGAPFAVSMEQRIVVEGGEGDAALVGLVAVMEQERRHGHAPNRRRRRALATTLTLENAMAAEAMTGFSSPIAARGSAATL